MAGFDVGELEGGSNTWKPEMGDQIDGTIVTIKRVQQTDFTTGAPLEWSDGSPAYADRGRIADRPTQTETTTTASAASG